MSCSALATGHHSTCRRRASRTEWMRWAAALVRVSRKSRAVDEITRAAAGYTDIHYDLAATALAQANLDWLNRLISGRVPLMRADDAFELQSVDVEVVRCCSAGCPLSN